MVNDRYLNDNPEDMDRQGQTDPYGTVFGDPPVEDFGGESGAFAGEPGVKGFGGGVKDGGAGEEDPDGGAFGDEAEEKDPGAGADVKEAPEKGRGRKDDGGESVDKVWLFMENVRIKAEWEKIARDKTMIEQKLDILKRGFSELDSDRKELKEQWARLEAREAILSGMDIADEDVSVFFRGAGDPISLKKRYRDLSKIYHPDNRSGDREVFRRITKEYERLKESMMERYQVV